MEKKITIKISVTEEEARSISELKSNLVKRGWRKKDKNVADLWFAHLSKKTSDKDKVKFINDNTPLNFLVSQALEDPKLKSKIESIIKEKNR